MTTSVMSTMTDEQKRMVFHYVSLTRFAGFAGYVLLIYETILTFSEEYVSIWSGRNTWLKWPFLLNKYMSIVLYTGVVVEMAPFPSLYITDVFCKGWLVTAAVFSILSITISNAIAMFRVAVVLQLRRRLFFYLLALLITTGLAATGVMTAAVVVVISKTRYSHTYSTCALWGNNDLIGIAVAMPIIVDVIVCALTLWNAFYRRRLWWGKCLWTELFHDGFFHFLAMLLTRLLAVLNTFIAPPALVFLGLLLTWTLITVILTRLTIQLRRSTIAPTDPSPSPSPELIHLEGRGDKDYEGEDSPATIVEDGDHDCKHSHQKHHNASSSSQHLGCLHELKAIEEERDWECDSKQDDDKKEDEEDDVIVISPRELHWSAEWQQHHAFR